MLQKFLKRIKVSPRSNNASLPGLVQTFLNEIKANSCNDSSRFTVDDEKRLHLSLFILGEGKGASNKWLFYSSTGDVTSNEDVKAIAELCFGNYRLKAQTDASKVHLYKPKGTQLRSPSTGILLSRVCRFAEEPQRQRNDTSQSSENEDALPVAGSPVRQEGGSGSSRSSAYFSSTESIFSQSPGRAGSLPRDSCPWLVNSVSRKSRVDISHRSSMDMFRLTQFMDVLESSASPANVGAAQEDRRKTADEGRKASRLRCDLGFVVLFQSDDADFAKRFRAFFFANFGCLESRMLAMCSSLAHVVERHSPNQCSRLYEDCFRKFKMEVNDLLFAPRLQRPVWLALSDPDSPTASAIRQTFLQRCLLVALDHYNTRHCVEALVTSILTHHLAWISTVEPIGTGLMAGGDFNDWQQRTPYNPHCAQINDLYGLLGSPLRLARTLVVGRDAGLVEFFLFLTSYFLRCSRVARRVEELPRCAHRPPSQRLSDPQPQEEKPSTPTTKVEPTSVDPNTVAISSLDSGLSSSEDVRVAYLATPDPAPEAALATVPCCPGGPPLMICRVCHFETTNAPYLEIPLLYGDQSPLPKTDRESPDSQEWEEEDDGTSMAWHSEGHSLLAGVHSHSTSFFALQGTQEAQSPETLSEQLNDMLSNNGVNEAAAEAVCILVDTDRLTVHEHRLSRGETRPRQVTTQPARCVTQLLTQVASLARMHLSAELCLRYLEDQLQGIYMSALAFGEANSNLKALGLDKSDVPLLEAIFSVHRPVYT